MEEDNAVARLLATLNVPPDEPMLPGIVPRDPEQHPLPGMDEPRNGNAQFLRDEDRTRPQLRPTLAMPGMDSYMGPVYPMRDNGFDAQAWAARPAEPERTPANDQPRPDIAEDSALGRLMATLRTPEETMEALHPVEPARTRGGPDALTQLMTTLEPDGPSMDERDAFAAQIEADLQQAQYGRRSGRSF
jgi:hypothetical protein